MKMRKGLFLPAMLGLSLFFLVSKDGSGRENPGKDKNLKKINYGTPASIVVNSLPAYIGLKRGFFRNEGIDLEIILMKTPIAIAGITSGSLDYAASAGDTIRSAAMGVPIKMVFISAHSLPHVLAVRPEINSVRDLKGKAIAVSHLLSSVYFAAYYIVKAYGLDPEKDLTLLPVGPGDMAVSSLLGGAVAGAMISPEYFLRSKERGFKQLAKTADYAKIPSLGIAVHNKKIKEKRDEVKRMVRASLKGLLFVRNNRKESIDFLIKEGGANPRNAPLLYDMEVDTLSKDGTVPDEALEQQIEIARKTVEVKGSVPLSQVADFSILREVLKELGLTP